MSSVPPRTRIQDECIIYYDKDDKCWVAHSLRMDQVGVGDCVIDALASLISAVDFVIEDASKDSSLAVFRDAPKEVQDMKAGAKKLPREIFEIAHKMVHGEWPKDLPLHSDPTQDNSYLTEIEEEDAIAV